MLADDLRRKIDDLWNRFWSGGIANPLSAIEQISYLIFLKRLEDLDRDEEALARRQGRAYTSYFNGHEECRWSKIKELSSPERMLELVRDKAFPFLKGLKTNGNTFPEAMKDAVFIIPKASLLGSAVDIIDTLPISDQNFDVQGDVYEHLLSELNLAGKNGQFRTPRHLIRVMVELTNPQLGEWIFDPAAGTGGFLVAAYQWVLKTKTPSGTVHIDEDGAWHNLTGELIGRDRKQWSLLDGDRFVGRDFDTTMVRLGLMNMMLHGIRHPEFRYKDTLSKSFDIGRKFDVILANPPFTGNIDKGDINTELLTLPTTKTELLFVELCIALLETGGRCAIIVPEGVLFGSTNAHKELRRKLVEENQIEAVISLPGGCFRPYTGVKTAILFFTRGSSTGRIWFYEVTGDGYTLDDKRVQDVEHNDLRFVPQAYRILAQGSQEEWQSDRARAVAEKQSWTATIEEVVSRNYSLAAGAYRPRTAKEQEYEDPRKIVNRIRGLEAQLRQKLDTIEEKLGEVLDA
jgi:type I restriction enzyme M protein